MYLYIYAHILIPVYIYLLTWNLENPKNHPSLLPLLLLCLTSNPITSLQTYSDPLLLVLDPGDNLVQANFH